MINKLIAVLLALSIALSCLVIPASASSGASDDVAASVGQYYAYLDQYLKGEITYEAFQAKSRAAFQDIKSDSDRSQVQQILDGLTSSLEGISYAGANMSAVPVKLFRDSMKQLDSVFGFWDNIGGKLYDAFESLWNEYANKNNYTDTDFDMSGYGAACVHFSNGEYRDTMYCAYGIIHKQWDNQIVGYSKDDVGCRRVFVNGKVFTSSPSVCGNLNDEYGNTYVFYGDWRYDDGSGNQTPADELISPNGKTPKDIDDLPDDTDLSDFFKELLDKLKNLFPDLSTIEGLLRAILAKCTEIENRMDEGGNGLTAAELQPLLDQAVLSLTLQNKTNNDAVLKSNDELLKELINIRKILQGFDSDEEVPPEEADSILQGLISGLTSGLISLIGSGFGDVEVSEIIEICTSAGTVGTKLLSGIVDIIGFLGALVPFSIIKTCIESTFNIMFNKNTPSDLTFTLDGDSYTFLSASFLDIPIVAGSLSILKGVVTIMVLYGWLKWARKFYINLM